MESSTRTAKQRAQQPGTPLSEVSRRGVYEAVFQRRDVRGEFLPTPIADAALARVLVAAHHAPSVGFMQPWDFIVIRSAEVKARVHALFSDAHAQAAEMFPPGQAQVYRGLKLEGIREAPINLCVTCDRRRAGPVVIGRTHIRAMDLYSTVCAVQNLWLAARAEGLGVGWVSIFDQRRLKQTLGIPAHIVPIAYLCIGHVSHFHGQPELASAGWRARLPIEELVAFDRWQGPADAAGQGLIDELQSQRQAVDAGRFIDDCL